ncbi:MAG: hypothetical protein V4486_02955 [Patescibacteria group bacterium]
MEPTTQPEQKTSGALIGSIIIIIILLVGGFFIWKNNMKNSTPNPEMNNIGANSNDGTASLEADANSMDLDSVDQSI